MADTLGSMLTEAAATLYEAGFDEPRRAARRLLTAALEIPPTELLADSGRSIGRGDAGHVRCLLARMLAREPLSRILGRREFWGLDFALSADTLDPRPESETVVEAVLQRIPNRGVPLRLLDLGTGSGCLLLALLSELPGAIGIGIDIAPGAVTTARRNAAALGLAGRAGFAVGDWGTSLSARFAVIVANPPYIVRAALAALPHEVADHDPLRALDGGGDGLAAYRSLAADLPSLLTLGGIFAAEIGSGQAAAVGTILRSRGMRIESVQPDLAGIDRCVIARYGVAPPALR